MEIEFTYRAEQNLEAIVNYLGLRWSSKIKTDLLAKLSEQLFLISEMPYLYPASPTQKNIRHCIIHKPTAQYYQVEPDKIILITIQDTRMNPDDLNI